LLEAEYGYEPSPPGPRCSYAAGCTGPEDLSLATIRDASAYHFVVQGPLSFAIAEAAAQAAGAPKGPDPSWLRQDWHPDQLQLIRGPGQDPST
jgi:hypothetical protein